MIEVKEEAESGGIENMRLEQQEDREYLFQNKDNAFLLTSVNEDNVQGELLLKLLNILRQSLPNMHINDLYNALFSTDNENLLFFNKKNLIGGLTFNCEQGDFAQVLFLGISLHHRSRGNGAYLMNVFKTLLQQRKIPLIVTHADNSSKGFYFKQGFSETEFISNSNWAPEEEHYYFTSKMQCLVNPEMPDIDYLLLKKNLKNQKKILINITKSHCLDTKPYQTTFSPRNQIFSRVEEGVKEYFLVDPESLGGIKKNGWSWSEYKRQISVKQTWSYRLYAGFFPLLYSKAQQELKKFNGFPVPTSEKPIDLISIAEKVMRGFYEQEEDFWLDFESFLRKSRQFYKRNIRITINLDEMEREMKKIRVM